LVSFAANRAIAICTQWLVAWIVRSQRQYQEVLQSQITEEQAKAEQQRRLIDILSHEIGSALTTIAGHAYRLTTLSRKLEPDDVVRRAGKIQGSALRIKAVVDRLQLAASLEGSRFPLRKRSINLRSVIYNVLRQLDDDQRDRFHVVLDGLHSCIEGDEVLMHQALENVLQNSLRYSNPKCSVQVYCDEHESRARTIITDQSEGIEPDDLSRLGTPYFRGKNSRGTRGTGLGLYLVEQIVKAHGGSVTISSEKGEGTTVVIKIPIMAADDTGAA
jgi:signal transduction histidine kinase